ncbi:MAG: thermonuclease family protein [Candidatus Omnitrophica bacterium]|nr:thermonuclease family protein [Candidatus Omnitrophota bacterium]
MRRRVSLERHPKCGVCAVVRAARHAAALLFILSVAAASARSAEVARQPAGAAYGNRRGASPQSPAAGESPDINFWEFEQIRVEEVVEGELLLLENGHLIRLIGVDTPDLFRRGRMFAEAQRLNIPVPVLAVMAQEARQFTRALAEKKIVRVEFDRRKIDQYGVLFGYVFIEKIPGRKGWYEEQPEEIFLNAEVIRQGYSTAIDTGDNRTYNKILRQIAEANRGRVKGLWGQWCFGDAGDAGAEAEPVAPGVENF